MGCVTDLADELLLYVALNLDAPSLASLALVSQRFRGVAQEVLHAAPTVSTECSSEGQIRELVITLLQRPDLATKVRKLSIELANTVEKPTPRWIMALGGVMNAAKKHKMDNSKWIQMIQGGYNLPWAGLLLAVTSKLEHLDLRLGTVAPLPMHRLPGDLFGSTGNCIPRDLSGMSSFESVTSLRIPERLLTWAWCPLPNLRRLEVHSGYNDPCVYLNTLHTPPKVETVIFHCTTSPIAQRSDYSCLPVFLSGFRALKVLEISFTNTRKKEIFVDNQSELDGLDFYDDDQSDDEELELYQIIKEPILKDNHLGSFATFIETLRPLSLTLESLTLSFPFPNNPNHSPMKFLIPFDTLKHFSSLKRLSIPQEALINSCEVDVPSRRIWELLPCSIGHLHVYNATIEVVSFISDVLECHEQFPYLTKCEFDITSTSVIESQEIWHSTTIPWEELKQVGIEITCFYSNKEQICGSSGSGVKFIKRNE